MANTYREVLSRASSFLESAGKEGPSILFVFLARKNWSKTDWLLQLNQPITIEDEHQIASDLAELMQDQPPQYLLGFADFYDHRLKVTRDTLIPRPETEELVEFCLQNTMNSPQKVVDIGTGTGAIAISLKLARPTWHVAAIDLVPATLAVARENAATLQAAIDFYLGDTLAPLSGQAPIDIIISNPPYISHEEWDLMDASVREFEPKQALFAEDNGLAIYRKIAQQAETLLAEKGKIFLEIGFQQGAAVQAIFQQTFPTKNVTIHQDMAGQDRMIYVH